LPKANNLLGTDENDSTRKDGYQLMNLTQLTIYLRGPGSSVGIATDYGLVFTARYELNLKRQLNLFLVLKGLNTTRYRLFF
jgi:hypothetical protein